MTLRHPLGTILQRGERHPWKPNGVETSIKFCGVTDRLRFHTANGMDHHDAQTD
jgi:hypothetical protein